MPTCGIAPAERCVFLKAFDLKSKQDSHVHQALAFSDPVRLRSAVPAQWARLGEAIWSAGMLAAGAVAGVIAPTECRACARPLLHAGGGGICATCVQSLSADQSAACDCCGEHVAVEDARAYAFATPDRYLCQQCRELAAPFVRATSFAEYDGTLRTLIRLYKFEGLSYLATSLGKRLAPVLLQAVEQLAAGDVHVVAVPLYRGRRSYNQSALLATAALRQVSRQTRRHQLLRSDAALRRTRPTGSQSQLSLRQRRENVRGAFATGCDVRGWRVVLVDDVYTSGETAKECTRTLLGAGAASVHVVTLARAQPDRAARWLQSPARAEAGTTEYTNRFEMEESGR